MRLHQPETNTCLGLDPQHCACACAALKPFEDVPPLERVRLIRAQVEVLRGMLVEAQARGLLPEEEAAFGELADAFAELADAWRTVFGE